MACVFGEACSSMLHFFSLALQPGPGVQRTAVDLTSVCENAGNLVRACMLWDDPTCSATCAATADTSASRASQACCTQSTRIFRDEMTTTVRTPVCLITGSGPTRHRKRSQCAVSWNAAHFRRALVPDVGGETGPVWAKQRP